MKVIGIDPGFGRCGFAVLSGTLQQMAHSTHGVITTPTGLPFPERLAEIAQDFQHLLSTHRPDRLVIEDLFVQRNVTTVMRVSQVRGVLIYLAHQHGLEIWQPKPLELKMAFCGHGRATKADMKHMAQQVFRGLDLHPTDDSVDALALAWFGLQQRFVV